MSLHLLTVHVPLEEHAVVTELAIVELQLTGLLLLVGAHEELEFPSHAVLPEFKWNPLAHLLT